MYCPRCGSQLKGGEKFCPNCGVSIWNPNVTESQSVETKQNTNDRNLSRTEVVVGLILAVVVLFILILTETFPSDSSNGSGSNGSGSGKESKSWTFNLSDNELFSGYSAKVRIYEESGSLYMDYNGQDFMNLSKSNLSFSHKLLMYDKTVDGIDMYSSTCPAPFNKYMWGLSGDKRTLYYLSGYRIVFTR